MRHVLCPDCGRSVQVPPGARSGERLECPDCAGTWIRLHESDGRWTGRRVHVVSCPACEQDIELPEDVRPGQRIRCPACGGQRGGGPNASTPRTFRVTYAYGAYALEPDA